MGFADDMVQDRKKLKPCRVEIARGQMGDDDREAFDKALADTEGVGTGTIVRIVALDSDVINLGRPSVQKHRDGICVCYLKNGGS